MLFILLGIFIASPTNLRGVCNFGRDIIDHMVAMEFILGKVSDTEYLVNNRVIRFRE